MRARVSKKEAQAEYVRRLEAEIKRRENVKKARASLADFILHLNKNYMMGWVHHEICTTLNSFLDDIKAKKSPRLIICMPPRSGKSEIVSRYLPAYALGLNPDLQIIASSYSSDLVSRFNRDVQRIIDTEEYNTIFPETSLNGKNTKSDSKTAYIRTSDLFEIVGHKGAYRSTGVGGGITGQGADCVHEDSFVLTPFGEVKAKNVFAGMPIIGYNLETNQIEVCTVEAVRERYEKEVFKLYCNSGRSLEVTGNHPVYTTEGGYKQAHLLAKGEIVLCSMPQGICDTRGRFYQACKERIKTFLLFQRLCKYSFSKMGHFTAQMPRLWGYLQKRKQILFKLFAKTSQRQTRQNRLSSTVAKMRLLWQGIFSFTSRSWLLCKVLFKKLRKQSPQSINARRKQSTLQGQCDSKEIQSCKCKSNLCAQEASQAKRRYDVRTLWRNLKNPLSSCGFRCDSQHNTKHGRFMRSLSYRSTQTRTGRDVQQRIITKNQKIFANKEQRFIDLQVSKTHNFFANGILVHNCLIIDDPIKDRAEANSATLRDKVWDWYTSTAYTRLSAGGGVIVMCTRWHTDDLIGRLIQKMNAGEGDKFHIINYPAIAEQDEPHRKKGEALHPERFDIDKLEAIRITVGAHDWASLYQQHPVPDGGAVFKIADFKRYNDKTLPPSFDQVVGSWDMTFKDSASSDYVVGQIWGRKGVDLFLLDEVRGQWDFTKTLEIFNLLVNKWSKVTRWLIEDKANGSAIISVLKKQIHGITPITPKESKLERAYAITPMIEAGNVYIPESATWLPALEDEILNFPACAHDDQIDSMTQALNYMRQHKGMAISPSNLFALSRPRHGF